MIILCVRILEVVLIIMMIDLYLQGHHQVSFAFRHIDAAAGDGLTEIT